MKESKKVKKNKVRGFQVIDDECIWMKAGVVNLHICNKVYDCFDCKFDKAMTRAMGTRPTAETVSNWAERFRESLNGVSRPCRHVLTGRIPQPKICTHNYECQDCAFDQMLDDIEISESQSVPDYVHVSGFNLAQDYYYDTGHTWVRIEYGGMARIGFDSFIMKLFGKAEFVSDSLDIGNYIKKGVSGWKIYQDSHTANVLSPVSGTVLSINERVIQNPDLMHGDPYQDGWLFIVEPDKTFKEVRKLKFGEESVCWMEQENKKLLNLLGPEYTNLAATGGEPVTDFFGYYPEIGWEKLVSTFLKT